MYIDIHISRWKHNIGDWRPNPNVENILKSCNLSFQDYAGQNRWVGAGHTNCTDPKTLRKQVTIRLIDLGIEKFKIRTFDQDSHSLYLNDSSLTWKPLYLYPLQDCLTLSMPENIRKLGIHSIDSYLVPEGPFSNLMVYVHQNGLQFTDTPDAMRSLEVSRKGGLSVAISLYHDVVELLKYDGEQCENDKDYKLNECKLEYVEQASDLCNQYNDL